MNKITVNLENCYGIRRLAKEFELSDDKVSICAVYAPNGSMKTSFAKTFEDLSMNQLSKDLIYGDERPSSRSILKEDGSVLEPEEVFVVNRYRENLDLQKVSTLLVRKELKDKFDGAHIKIDLEKTKLLKDLTELSGLKTGIEEEIIMAFQGETDNFFPLLEQLRDLVLDKTEPEFQEINYNEIFNEKTLTFLETKEFKNEVIQYIEKYNELIEASDFFKIFNHSNASDVAKSLDDNNFFKAEHTVLLKGVRGDKEIKTKGELEVLIEEEKSKILDNPELKKTFEEINKAIRKNEQVKKFHNYLLKNERIIVELGDLGALRKKLWISYLKIAKNPYENLIEEYQKNKPVLDEIVEEAKMEQPRWQNVIDSFNKRFSVPFKLVVENQKDVILHQKLPSIVFEFCDTAGENKTVGTDQLIKVLSNGESRALYLLNIIFEVEARKNNAQKTLFVIDDIADSFDYKNKYAIIEYLSDISKESNFKQIILTHNFDFFRTIQLRLKIHRERCFMVEKSKADVVLVRAEHLNLFENLMDGLTDDKKLVASIPFARNLIEYTRGSNDPEYMDLTALLHVKSNSNSILKSNIQQIYRSLFLKQGTLTLSNDTERVIDLIYRLAEDCLTARDGVNFENKIILAIAIRLRGEEFMFSKLTEKGESTHQTRTWFERYKKEFQKTEKENIKTLERVVLMTPENIHLNSFMYEPILDMSDESLKELYREVKTLA